jgi:hypothetical protein
MYDDIFCECDLPDELGPEERRFQTRYHFARSVQDTGPPNGLFRMIPVEKQDMDMHFHGDIS